MIVLSAKELTKSYGTDVILDKVSFHINKGERVGIIGVNGAGKTTLLKILTGELSCEEGEFFVSSETNIGYLKQDGGFDSENTVMEEVENIFGEFHRMEKEMEALLQRIEETAGKTGDDGDDGESRRLLERYDALQEKFKERGGYTYRSEMMGILSSMAFGEDSYGKKISTLSGGEKTRLALACLLMKKPDILLLDEPTNHLDIGTLKWLEQYLKSYKGTIILVSHDRYFLDETVTRIFEVENHKLSIYEGDYSFYATERKKRREAEMRRYENQQKEIRRQEDMIRRFKERGTEKLAKRAASREKRLAAMEVVERPAGERDRMKISFRADFQSGRDVLEAGDVSKSFGYGAGRTELFRHVDLDIKRGERVCIVGANGIGKTTLLKILMGEISCNTGRIKIGYNVKFGYYDQGQQLLNGANTVIEEVRDSYGLYSDGEIRNILGRFMFRGEDVFLKVGALSGGEKARLSLLKLMLSGANVLMLDEPTNHLDIESKEVFEEALLEFPGTSIIVSHDRYFLNRIPTRIMELTSDGIENYLGTYDYYVEKKQQQIQSGKKYLEGMQEDREARTSTAAEEVSKGAGAEAEEHLSSAERRRIQKEKEAEERRLRRHREALEKEIQSIEEEIGELEAELCRQEVATDHVKLAEIGKMLTEKKDELDDRYEKWLQLQEQ
ncbi:MAG: ABC-F family ATP-binding cassette domain-containing protein [Anaerovoracaceae bacterium]|uniref:ABC-F family ATP-binding cassette domain-containing protein n=1 Tax=Candidatus Allocopromorpha excrementipullorum TaxID=2840743 RepID=A0A9D1N6X9_9FIRM|nr:ABC-F family ATP-binding cassette domain-containing protein [Anaerovoracaceae bacterium]HIU96005.1 ABC-F family ATP-binding cassette domain-containing protein [Candidatus Copromorpha excrementipullorum]